MRVLEPFKLNSNGMCASACTLQVKLEWNTQRRVYTTETHKDIYYSITPLFHIRTYTGCMKIFLLLYHYNSNNSKNYFTE